MRDETSNYTDRDRSSFIDVFYDPQNPHRVQAADSGFPYVLPGILMVNGVLLVWLAVHTWRHGLPDWLRRD